MQESQNEARENLDCDDFYEFGYRPQKTLGKKKTYHLFKDEWNPSSTSGECVQLIHPKLL